MIYEDKIISNILRGVRKGFKRLRKSEWTNESLRIAVPKANAFLKGKCALDGPKIFYNFRMEECKGRVVGMADGEFYYYQTISYDVEVFWGDKRDTFIEENHLQIL